MSCDRKHSARGRWRRTAVGLAVLWLVFAHPTDARSQPILTMAGGMGFSTTGYDQEVADKFNIASRGFGFQSTLSPRLFGYTVALIEFGWEYLAQLCVDGSDCETDRTATSSAYASLGGGVATPVLYVNDRQGRVGFSLTFNAGYQWVKTGLSQDGCVNCTIDDLYVAGGSWIEPGLDLYADPEVVLGFAFRIYEDEADLVSRFTLRVTTQAGKSKRSR